MTGIVAIDRLPEGHPGWELLLGATPLAASAADQRLASTLYVPRRYREIGHPLPLLVAVHGTGRNVERTRDRFRDFAEEHGVAVLAPLFPAGLVDPNDVHNYKGIEFGGIRFDVALLAMVEEAATRYRLAVDRFLLTGFSGGGQFAHRFAYLHPERLLAVSVGAPGRVTLPDREEWPHGLGGAEERFGTPIDLAALRSVPVQVVVGAADEAAELLAAVAADPREARAGATRVERALGLADALRAVGATVEVGVVAGAGHDADATTGAVTGFFGAVLAASR